MPRLVACPHCQSHAISTESRCPHCGGALKSNHGRLAATAAAALLGLAPVACDKGTPTAPPTDSGGVAEPEYGVPDTSEPGVDEPDPVGEPEYGVPVTDEDPEMAPMYGVPDSDAH